MTLKERFAVVEKTVQNLEEQVKSLQTQIINHSGIHTWDRIVGYIQLILMVVVIVLLKFKIL